MKKRSLLLTLFACLFTIGQAKDYADYVNPLVGTQSTFELSTGNTYPAIARPAMAGNILIPPQKSAGSSRPTSPARG